jgi:hypothetical protein
MKEIKLRFEPADLAVLDKEAQLRGITRSELLRERVLGAPVAGRYDVGRFNKLLADSQKYMQGHVDRRLVETLVSYVFNRLSND